MSNTRLADIPTVKTAITPSSGSNIFLDKDTPLYHFGKPIGSLGTIESDVRCDCPDGHKHSDGMGSDYAKTTALGGGEVGIHCSGNECSGLRYLPDNELTQEQKIEWAKQQDAQPFDEVLPIEGFEGKKLTIEALHELEIIADISSTELLPLSGRNILFDNGLHMFYAPSGNMKSFTVASLAAEVSTKKNIFYFDFEYNPGALEKHCEKLGITYLTPTNEYNEVEKLLKSKMDLSDTLLIFDSFSYLIEEGNNDATDTKEVVHEMRLLCKELGATVIYIDHATILTYKDRKSGEEAPIHKRWQYKVEGNASGKIKPCDLVYLVEPNDPNSYTDGVNVLCFKSRTAHRKKGDIVEACAEEPFGGHDEIQPF